MGRRTRTRGHRGRRPIKGDGGERGTTPEVTFCCRSASCPALSRRSVRRLCLWRSSMAEHAQGEQRPRGRSKSCPSPPPGVWCCGGNRQRSAVAPKMSRPSRVARERARRDSCAGPPCAPLGTSLHVSLLVLVVLLPLHLLFFVVPDLSFLLPLHLPLLLLRPPPLPLLMHFLLPPIVVVQPMGCGDPMAGCGELMGGCGDPMCCGGPMWPPATSMVYGDLHRPRRSHGLATPQAAATPSAAVFPLVAATP